ncbi:uncharacterized protein LOC126656798 [Mercurialis annua]|uniref:uncharacterized protein LOC126656798 n=1 Tax=Mercurialis annua TaxID=3986 RepID=UPI0021606FF6|nr:uncharacterized protein LOC126656798 [Mercurialis annua]
MASKIEGNNIYSVPKDVELNIHLFYKHLFQPQTKIMTKNKAPGPDGFNFFFYKKAWGIIKQDFLHLFSDFHRTGTFLAGLNTTFLVLIPKVKGAIDIKVFDLSILSMEFSSFCLNMNFDNSWIRWMSSFFFSTQLSGVRQGDPFSPMLFVLAVEGLKALFEKAVSLGLNDGIRVDCYSNSISLLQLVDDNLIFLPNDLEMLQIFSYKIKELPITYLGLPLSLKPIKAKFRDPIVCNFSQQQAGWKGKLLSSAGRLVLVKFVLSSFPIYYLYSFLIPQSVVLSLERLMHKFLWNGSVLNSGFNKVA